MKLWRSSTGKTFPGHRHKLGAAGIRTALFSSQYEMLLDNPRVTRRHESLMEVRSAFHGMPSCWRVYKSMKVLNERNEP